MTPQEAYVEAFYRGPSDRLREKACEDPYWAFCYAVSCDRAAHPDTRSAVKGTEWQARYESEFGPAPEPGVPLHSTERIDADTERRRVESGWIYTQCIQHEGPAFYTSVFVPDQKGAS